MVRTEVVSPRSRQARRALPVLRKKQSHRHRRRRRCRCCRCCRYVVRSGRCGMCRNCRQWVELSRPDPAALQQTEVGVRVRVSVRVIARDQGQVRCQRSGLRVRCQGQGPGPRAMLSVNDKHRTHMAIQHTGVCVGQTHRQRPVEAQRLSLATNTVRPSSEATPYLRYVFNYVRRCVMTMSES